MRKRGQGKMLYKSQRKGMAGVSTQPSVYGNALHALGLLSLLADVQVKHAITVAGLQPGASRIGDKLGVSRQQLPFYDSTSKQAAHPSQAQTALQAAQPRLPDAHLDGLHIGAVRQGHHTLHKLA